MSTILTQTPSDILDHYADVIEGGTVHRGSGTSMKGIPGMHSHDELAGTALTSDASTDTTTVTADDLSAARASRLVRTDHPPMFLRCTSQASGTGNIGAARKITAYASGSYTVAPAFPESVQSGDTFVVEEGFKRAPDHWDLESEEEGIRGGFDRFFRLALMPGTRHPRYGNSVQQFASVLELRMRFCKRTRDVLARATALDNAMRMRAVLTRQDVRDDGGLVQVLDASQQAPEIAIEDSRKLVVSDVYGIIYRVNATYL